MIISFWYTFQTNSLLLVVTDCEPVGTQAKSLDGVCNCKAGYNGSFCEICDTNYHFNNNKCDGNFS